jgi:hypothetical protein
MNRRRSMKIWNLALLTLAPGAVGAAFAEPAAAADGGRRVIVAIGSNRGLSNEPKLSYAELDAARFARVMVELGGVAAEDAQVLPAPNAEAVLARVRREGQRLDTSAALIVYYSGHGSETGLHLGKDVLPLAALRAAIDQSGAGLRLLIIDSCRDLTAGEAAQQAAGIVNKGIIVSPNATFDIDVTLQGRLDLRGHHQGVIEMRSTAAGGKAAESHSLRAGVFSHHLLSGMRGPADFDGDGGVSVEEAYTFAYHRTVYDSRWGTQLPQEPAIATRVEGAGPLLLTSLSSSQSVLTLPPEDGVEYEVFELGSEVQFAEAWSRAKQPMRIGLPAGHFVVHRRKESVVEVASVSLVPGAVQELKVEDFRPWPTSAGTARGGLMEVREHGVRAGLGPLVDDGGRFGQAVALSYSLGTVGWQPTVSAHATRRRFLTAANETARDTVSLGGGIAFATGGHGVGASLGLSLMGTLIDQNLEDRESVARLHQTSFGMGPLTRAGVTFGLTPSVGVAADVVMLTTFFQAAERVKRARAETSLQLATGLAVAF